MPVMREDALAELQRRGVSVSEDDNELKSLAAEELRRRGVSFGSAPIVNIQPSLGSSLLSDTGNLLKGGLKSVGESAAGFGELAELPAQTASKVLPDFKGKDVLMRLLNTSADTLKRFSGADVAMLLKKSLGEDVFEPEGGAEKVGFFAGEVAPFILTPTQGIQKTMLKQVAKRSLPKAAKKGLALAGKAGIEAGQAGMIRAVQTGGDESDVLLSTAVGGALPVIGAPIKKAIKGSGRWLKKTGERIQNILIKPTAADLKDRFSIKFIDKYDLGGSLHASYEKLQKKLADTALKVKQKIKGTDKPIDMVNVLAKVEKQLLGKESQIVDTAQFKSGAVQKLIPKYFDDVMKLTDDTGFLSPEQAQLFKQSVGQQGAWLAGTRDLELEATEKFANAVYRSIKEEIENAAPAGLKELNKELSELLSVKHAIIRRLPIAERNQILPLKEAMFLASSAASGNALPLVGAGFQMATTSGNMANQMVKRGSRLAKYRSGKFSRALQGAAKQGFRF